MGKNMKKIFLIGLALTISLSACNKPKQADNQKEVQALTKEIKKLSEPKPTDQKYFAIESAYVKYKNLAAGQELTREWWFDQYGKRQYEENYMIFMDQKTGGKTIIIDGYQYQWDYDSKEGTKRKFYQSVTDYDKVSENDIKRYGITKQGYEDILGKSCLKVSIEKPAKSTVWTWNNIPMKTEAVFAGNKVVMEAVEIKTENIDKTLFNLPADVTFQEAN